MFTWSVSFHFDPGNMNSFDIYLMFDYIIVQSFVILLCIYILFILLMMNSSELYTWKNITFTEFLEDHSFIVGALLAFSLTVIYFYFAMKVVSCVGEDTSTWCWYFNPQLNMLLLVDPHSAGALDMKIVDQLWLDQNPRLPLDQNLVNQWTNSHRSFVETIRLNFPQRFERMKLFASTCFQMVGASSTETSFCSDMSSPSH